MIGTIILQNPPPYIFAVNAPYCSITMNIWQRLTEAQQSAAITAPKPKSLTHAGAFQAETRTAIRNSVITHIGPLPECMK